MENTPTPSPMREMIAVVVWPLPISIAAGLLCWWAAGISLGLFLGGLGFLTLLLPGLALAEGAPARRLLSAAAVVDGVAVVWLVALSVISVPQWIALYVLLAAYAAALLAVAWALERLGLHALLAAALSTLVGLAWLTWPVWLAPWLAGAWGQRVAACLIPPYPVMAVNAVVHQELGIWTQQALAYRLQKLGQDVQYALPSGVWMAVLVHAAIAAVLLALISRVRRG